MVFLGKKKYNELIEKIDSIEGKVENAGSASPALPHALSEDEKRQAAYALNLCAVSVSQIIDYNDLYILEQEYDAILNNLNLQNFVKHEALLEVLKQILDTITFFKIQEGDKRLVEKEYQHKMKNAMFGAIPNFGVILLGGNPLQIAITLASQVGIGYMNYRKNKSEYSLEQERQEWELQRSAYEQFNGLRRQLFETAWRLSDSYGFDDEMRLTEKQISRYNAVLMDYDPLRRYERLESLSKDFKAFPPFWYSKGSAARDVYHNATDLSSEAREAFKLKAIESYDMFDQIHLELLREDLLAASCALEHISLLNPDVNSEKIKKLLNRAIRLAGQNYDVLQICVMVYVSLGDELAAMEALRLLVNENYNLEMNGKLLTRLFIKEGNKIEYEILVKRIGARNTGLWFDSEAAVDAAYLADKKQMAVERLTQFSQKIIQKQYQSFTNDLGYSIRSSNKEKISRFMDCDVHALVSDSFDKLFLELQASQLFDSPATIGFRWEDLSISNEACMEKIEKIPKEEKRIRAEVTENRLNIWGSQMSYDKSHNKDLTFRKSMDDLLNTIESIYNDYFKDIVKKFKEIGIGEAPGSADAIIDVVNKWCTKNNVYIAPSTIQVEE